jgi:hypothetical protein
MLCLFQQIPQVVLERLTLNCEKVEPLEAAKPAPQQPRQLSVPSFRLKFNLKRELKHTFQGTLNN